MKYLIGIILVLTAATSGALSLNYYAETEITNSKKAGATLGGFSAASFNDSKLWLLSDDRGRLGEPRISEFEVSLSSNKIDLNFSTHHFLSKAGENNLYFDGEGLGFVGKISQNEAWILSSEGDNNSKPRKWPEIVIADSKFKIKKQIKLPEDYLPEKTGEQKKGILNNRGFEGLAILDSGLSLLIMTESALIQDMGVQQPRWILYTKQGDDWLLSRQGKYPLSSIKEHSIGFEVFRGVSEILHIQGSQYFVLERALLLSKNGPLYTGEIYLWNENSSEKKMLVDLRYDLLKKRGDKAVQNFEALTWGPLIGNKRTLLVISDNNFSKREKSEVLAFVLEE